MSLSIEALSWLTLAAMITGISKFSTGGMGMVILPVLMLAIPDKKALGVIIVMYIITDILAVLSYRKSVNKTVIMQVMPAAVIGILIGTFVLKGIDDRTFILVLFGLTVFMLAISLLLDKYPIDVSRYAPLTYLMGLLTGLISMVGNAAGPIFSIYLLAVGNINKESYIGTRAWVFLLMNVCKGIGLVAIGLADWQTLEIGLYSLPGVLLGALLGFVFLKKINMNTLKWVIRLLIVLAAVRLLYAYCQ